MICNSCGIDDIQGFALIVTLRAKRLTFESACYTMCLGDIMSNTIGIAIIILIVLGIIATVIYLIKAYVTEYKDNGFFRSVIEFIITEDLAFEILFVFTVVLLIVIFKVKL